MPDPSVADNTRFSSEQAQAIARRLIEGELAVLPTDTVYGIFAASGTPGIDRLGDLASAAKGPVGAWHAPDVASVTKAFGWAPTEGLPNSEEKSAVCWRFARAAKRVLAMGCTADLECDTNELAAAGAATGTTEGEPPWSDNGAALVRVPNSDVFAQIAHACEGRALVGRGAPSGPTAPTDWTHGPVVDIGRLGSGTASTRVRVERDGSWRITREGSTPSRVLERALAIRVLFVCTGNTCRSPMAEAIARAITPGDAGVVFSSAGVYASAGSPATDEAVVAAGDFGGDLSAHRSRPLNAADLREADAIYAMTPEHAQAAKHQLPEIAQRIQTLDPDGGGIPDPIGGPQDEYTQTARRIESLVRARLAPLLDGFMPTA